MGDIIDAGERFAAHRFADWWVAFTSEQMETARLYELWRRYPAFRQYCAKRLAQTRREQLEARRIEAAEAEDMA